MEPEKTPRFNARVTREVLWLLKEIFKGGRRDSGEASQGVYILCVTISKKLDGIQSQVLQIYLCSNKKKRLLASPVIVVLGDVLHMVHSILGV